MSGRMLKGRCGHGYHYDGHKLSGCTADDWCNGGEEVALKAVPWCAVHDMLWLQSGCALSNMEFVKPEVRCRQENPSRHWRE